MREVREKYLPGRKNYGNYRNVIRSYQILVYPRCLRLGFMEDGGPVAGTTSGTGKSGDVDLGQFPGSAEGSRDFGGDVYAPRVTFVQLCR
jgi:hypothetical protein